MSRETLKESFIKFCKKKKFEKNRNQLKLISLLDQFIQPQKFLNFFPKKKVKLCFYLSGNVGVGKTMILDFYYNYLKISKKRYHFNEFMINFHAYRHKKKEANKEDKWIPSFVKNLKKKCKLIYLDEFQVTNIVDAMILGKLFDCIFKEKIKVLITSNILLDDLYKDGLQREQFLPFISLIKKNSLQKELIFEEDYRISAKKKYQRYFWPINENTLFKINYFFRKLTKNKKNIEKKFLVKGRSFKILNFYDGIAKFDFKDLCDANTGAEDFIKLADICSFIMILNLPNFSKDNINQQQRFITLIDIFYEKKIPLLISSEFSLDKIGSSDNLAAPFKRTISRLFELTSIKHDQFFSSVV